MMAIPIHWAWVLRCPFECNLGDWLILLMFWVLNFITYSPELIIELTSFIWVLGLTDDGNIAPWVEILASLQMLTKGAELMLPAEGWPYLTLLRQMRLWLMTARWTAERWGLSLLTCLRWLHRHLIEMMKCRWHERWMNSENKKSKNTEQNSRNDLRTHLTYLLSSLIMMWLIPSLYLLSSPLIGVHILNDVNLYLNDIDKGWLQLALTCWSSSWRADWDTQRQVDSLRHPVLVFEWTNDLHFERLTHLNL